MTEQINNWHSSIVDVYHRTWGQGLLPYTKHMFDFCLSSNSFLDLGCGFGRFLRYLSQHKKGSFTYIGYDSSPAMLDKLKEEFPEYKSSPHLHDITKPFNHKPSCIIASAVFIHLLFKDQLKVLDNIAATSPHKITFDIDGLKKSDKKRLVETLNRKNFRITRQSVKDLNLKLIEKFPNYEITKDIFKDDENPVRRFNVCVFTLTRNQ